MSYASAAKSHIPAGEMPKPDQSLADGHFAGETSAHALHTGDKINVLPAGSDLEHPPIEDEQPARPEPITLHRAEPEVSHALNVAPEPTKVPVDTTKWEHVEKDLEQDAKATAKQAEEKGKEVADKAEKKGKELADTAEKKGKDLADAAEKKGKELGAKAEKVADDVADKAKDLKKKAKAELKEAENKLEPYWEKTKDVVLRPGTLGGLMGVVNVGLLGTLGYFAYTRRDQPWDRRLVGGAVAGTLALFSAEGYVTESYLSTPEGRQEAERAKREGSRAYMQAKEVILRPGVAGGLVGLVNVAVLSTVGYFSYKHWNNVWDPRVVSAVTVGLVGLSGLEGYAGKAYADKELPKRR